MSPTYEPLSALLPLLLLIGFGLLVGGGFGLVIGYYFGRRRWTDVHRPRFHLVMQGK